MSNFHRRFLCAFILLVAPCLRAQNGVPTVTKTMPAQVLVVGGGALAVDLKAYFDVLGVNHTAGWLVQFDTVLGRVNIELFKDDAPINCANFLRYVSAGSYTNTIIHRSETGFVIQGGGYLASSYAHISNPTSAALEYKLPNAEGTVAMARGTDVNSATSEWFFNTADNTDKLGVGNGGGYTVFARVLGSGMTVVNAIAKLPITSSGNFTTLPVRNLAAGGTPAFVNLVVVNSVKAATVYPSAPGDAALITFSVNNQSSAIVSTTVLGSTLTLTPVAAGSGELSIRAVDANGNLVTQTFTVTVAVATPTIVAPPRDVVVGAGQTLALNVAATGPNLSYQWKRAGTGVIAGATSPTLVRSNLTAADAGVYFCTVSNASGSVDSAGGTVTVGAAGQVTRLSNLSVRANLGAGQLLIVGFSTTGAKSLLVRGIGPKLADFSIPDFYADPLLEIYNGTTLVTSNDNWAPSLATAFASVGAFALNASSKDAALLTTVSGSGTAQLKGTGAGVALVEVYDAGGGFAPRLSNVSARNVVGTGANILIAGFNIDGPVAKTLLIRAVGPKLTAFDVRGVLADPKLEVYLGAVKLAENDDWNASAGAFFAPVGAFWLDVGSKDAALLITLPPGGYTAQVSGVAGTTGEALIEVYEVP